MCVVVGGLTLKAGWTSYDANYDVDDVDADIDDENDDIDDDDDVVGREEGRVDICSPEWFHGFMARYIAQRVTS